MKEPTFESDERFAKAMTDIVVRRKNGDRLGLLVLYNLTVEQVEEIYKRLEYICEHLTPLEGRVAVMGRFHEQKSITLTEGIDTMEALAVIRQRIAEKDEDTDNKESMPN